MVRYKGTPTKHFCIASQKHFVATKKKRAFRHRQGFRVRQELRKQMMSTTFSIPKLAFRRLVREILHERHGLIDRIEARALHALQSATEYHLATLFRVANECTSHDKRVTLQVKDLRLFISYAQRKSVILSNNPNVWVPKRQNQMVQGDNKNQQKQITAK